jgi:hypothetical protein
MDDMKVQRIREKLRKVEMEMRRLRDKKEKVVDGSPESKTYSAKYMALKTQADEMKRLLDQWDEGRASFWQRFTSGTQ